MIIQALDLKVGERAICSAGYPTEGTLIVECIKDFQFSVGMKHFDHIVQNPLEYVKIVHNGLFGPLDSHWISGLWEKGNVRKPGSGGSRPNVGRKKQATVLSPVASKIDPDAAVWYKAQPKGTIRKVLEAHFNAFKADA